MRIRTVVIAAALLTLSLPSVAQRGEGKAYFSLSSSRTVAPGEYPAIRLWASGLRTLQFRVYKVNDPVKFFQQLEDPHNFGGRAPAVPRNLTPIERLHRWKRRLRIRLRNIARSQFTSDSRGQIRDWLAPREQEAASRKNAAPVPATQYAAVPVLNPQQVVAVWEQHIPPGKRWSSRTVRINVKDKGVYLVEATNGKLRAYTIVSITSLVLLSKTSTGRVMLRAVDRVNGAPVAGCDILVWLNGKTGKRLTTDAQGVAETRIEEKQVESLLLLAHKGGDFAVNGTYGWSVRAYPNQDLTGVIYTDRPVYRPGHQVHFRGMLRIKTNDGYVMPPEKTAEVEVRSPDRKTLFKKSLPISEFGTFEGSLRLPEGEPLGYHDIEVRVGEARRSGGFQVEEYRKPEFAVTVRPARRRYLQGELMKVSMEARYYYGEPVAHGKVTYEVFRSLYWAPWMVREQEELEQQAGLGRRQVLRAKGNLDERGRLTVTIPNKPGEKDFIYRIRAKVTDASNREVSGSGYTVATVGPFFIQIRAKRYLCAPGDKARFRVSATDYDGKPVSNVPFRVELVEYHWKNPERPLVALSRGRTGKDGKASVEFTAPAGGSFLARVAAKTPSGRKVRDEAYLWVSGAGSVWGSGPQQLQIVPDKSSYQPGDTARVLIVTGVKNAHLWVTTEGRSVRFSRFVDATGPTATVEIPIVKEYEPNFFVTALFLKNDELHQGSKSINVPASDRKLNVRITSSKKQFQPGETGTFTVLATDGKGQPVEAEFSLGVVDESIYAVRKERLPLLKNVFWGKVWNRVNSDSSLEYYFSGEAGKRRMQLAGVRRSRNRAQLKPARFVKPKVRKAFPDTIYWIANLRTDAAGRATARVSYPDALTTWRATTRGITRDTKVGEARQYTISRKNLILTLSTPRFLTSGDEVVVSAIVHNYLKNEKRVRVSLEVQGLDLIEGKTADLRVPSRGEAIARYRVRATGGGEAVLLGKALSDEESDALELRLPVVPYGVKLTSTKGGTLSAKADEAIAEFSYLPGAVGGSRRIEISVTPSIAGTVLTALSYLTSYPWGCTEQTTSSLLGNVVVRKTVSELHLKTDLKKLELDKKLRAGLQRLYDFQNPDGGWGWWKTGDSEPFMTAYVVLVLNRVREAGYPIQQYRLSRGLRWLYEQVPAMRDVKADVRAYVVHSLVVNAPATYKHLLGGIWKDRSELSPYGLALLGLAMQQVGDSRAAAIADRLEGAAKSDTSGAWWEVDRDWFLRLYTSASPEATAHVLKFLTKARPRSPLLSRAASWLVANRNRGYYWSSTKQTALVLYGLTDYLKAGNELEPDFQIKIEVNGREVLSRRFDDNDMLSVSPVKLAIDATKLGDGPTHIRITKSGTGRLYWSAQSQYYTTGKIPEPKQDRSLSLRREYFRLVPVRREGRIVYRLDPLTGAVKPGDMLAVRLTVKGDEFRYLLIEDPIPAGTEFVRRDDLYELADKPPWWAFWFGRRELRDDRAVYYRTYFTGSGDAEYVYLLKVVNPGRFLTSPARVFPMYEPGYLRASESKILNVQSPAPAATNLEVQ